MEPKDLLVTFGISFFGAILGMAVIEAVSRIAQYRRERKYALEETARRLAADASRFEEAKEDYMAAVQRHGLLQAASPAPRPAPRIRPPADEARELAQMIVMQQSHDLICGVEQWRRPEAAVAAGSKCDRAIPQSYPVNSSKSPNPIRILEL